MYETLLNTIQHDKLFPPNQRILVAVSGGADSIALLHALARLQSQLAVHLHVATLDHGLRPTAPDDVAYVRSIAQKLNIPLTTGAVDVRARADSSSIEEAARHARYDFLADVAGAIGATHIATAHHADDQSETILMHILRGAGITGLVGMQTRAPVPRHPHLTLVRPLLHCRRQQIEAYCREHDLHPRHDESNDDPAYFRNVIRLQILPYLRQFNPNLDQALYRLSDVMRVEQDYMQTRYQRVARPHIQRTASIITINRDAYQGWHPALQRYALRQCVMALGGEPSHAQTTSAVTLASDGAVGALAQFSGGLHMRVGYDDLVIEPQAQTHERTRARYLHLATPQTINPPQTCELRNGRITFSWDADARAQARLALAPDARLRLRTRQAGDRWRPLGMGGRSRKLKDWFIDQKIPQAVRSTIPLLTADDEIVAIILPDEWKVAESARVGAQSQFILYAYAEMRAQYGS